MKENAETEAAKDTGRVSLCTKRVALAAVVFSLAALVVFSAVTGAYEKAVAPSLPPVLSGSEIHYPPFCIVDQSGRADGFSVELLRAAISAMGRSVSFRTGNWTEVKSLLETGEIQALPLVGRTPERENLFDFTFPYITLHGAIVVRKDTSGIKNLHDLAGKQVAVMRGDNAEEFLRREERGIEIHTTATFEEALQELSRGKFDAVVIQRLVALRLIQGTGLTNLTVVNRPIEGFDQDFCFAVKEGDRDNLALLNEGLAIIMADGTYRQLHYKWFANLDLPSDRRIVIGGDNNFPPYEYRDKNGLPTGYNVDLTRAIAREIGLDIEIRLGSWAEIRQELAMGEIDALQGMFYSTERDKMFDFTPPHLVVNYVAVVRKGEGPAPATTEELAGKRIVVQRGDIMHDFTLEKGLGKQVDAVESQELALKELAEGRYDCTLVTRQTALYGIDKYGWNNLTVGNHPFISAEYCYAVQNNSRAFLAQLSEGLAVLKETGEYRRIQEKWFGIYDAQRPALAIIVRYMVLIGAPLLMILLVTFMWLWSLRKQVARRTLELAAVSQRQQAILSAVPDIIMEVNTHKIYTWANRAGLEFFGTDVIGREAASYFLGEQDTYAAVKPLFNGDDNVVYIESWQRRQDGQKRLLAWWCRVLKDPRGLIVGALSTAHDITERNRTVVALRESEHKFKHVFENLPIGISMTLPAGEIQTNRYFRNMLGYAEDCPALKWQEITHPDDIEVSQKIIDSILSGEKDSVQFEKRYIHKNGSVVWAEVNTTIRRGSEGREDYLLTAVNDITGRKAADEKIKNQLNELQRWQDIMLGREDRIQELKREVNELCRTSGEAARYPSQNDNPTESDELNI